MKTFNVKFWLKPSRKKGENDLGILYVRVTVDGIRTEISLNRKVLMTNWDTLRGIPIGKSTSDRELHSWGDGSQPLLSMNYAIGPYWDCWKEPDLNGPEADERFHLPDAHQILF